ncbi:WxL domain-containing protein [Carnobacterium maltaromaticum]|uniref:Cell surface protein with WxL domain n=1 Tax=Carnobacterium maltaromaticum LMA28 TaxID=1234679 RepID=K8EDF7_CARML|nr:MULTISPECIES: WxL domain-containing protein [Carnobacterium]AOA03726.1 hypothetical protein BFC23_14955 [Carnobacterium maltaromaticum]MBQ6485010.1 WxL domain-containing protein [Carnobacterium sp.]MCI1819420.1 WxL domain-containing protein [Carnobacterium maltaromaticum]MDW5524241.1 WxL domain-containing protein [Carnobacterium maltaromaticum]CCO09788.2 cell surface protein with WxL domain [Carnobacterium maltaromaticum LMA28]
MTRGDVMKVGTLCLLAPLVLVSLGGAVVDAATAGTMNSISDVTFTTNTDPTNPVNPTDPTKPVLPVDPLDPADPHEPGTAGPLSIDYVSNFHFGNKVIQVTDATYYASMDSVKDVTTDQVVAVPNYLQVTDKRGSNVGWKVTVTQNGQFKTANTTPDVLDNAQLKLTNATSNSTMNPILAPTASALVTIDPLGASSSLVVSAAEDKGMGTWTTAFGDAVSGGQSISLSVPGTTDKVKNVQYKASLTWNLEDGPL